MAAKVKTTVGRIFGELTTLNVISNAAKSYLLNKCSDDKHGRTDYKAKIAIVESLGIIVARAANDGLGSHTQLTLLVPDKLLGKLMGAQEVAAIGNNVRGCKSIWRG